MKKPNLKLLAAVVFFFSTASLPAQNNVQSELTRIFIETQEAQSLPTNERDAKLTDLDAQRTAILNEQKSNFNTIGIDDDIKGVVEQFVSVCLNCVEVGSVSDARFGSYGYTLDGYEATNQLSKLTNPANFGSGGTVSTPLNFTHVSATITASVLANFDVFYIGWWEDGTFSNTELDAIYNWVQAGGNLICTADDVYHDEVAARFGFPNTGTGNTIQNVVLTTHPAFMGPFGTITTYYAGGNIGQFNQGSATLLAQNSGSNTPTALETTIGSGTVLLFHDVNVLDDWNTTSGNGITNNNDILLGNVFAYMAQNMATTCPTTNTFDVKMPDALYQAAGANQANTYYPGLSKAMKVTANPAGGSGSYTYSWSNSMGFTLSGTSNQKAYLYYPTSGSWMVCEITDVVAGCSVKDSVWIDVIDFTCNQPNIWWYQLCNTNTMVTSCVQGTSNMETLLMTGDYVFGSCTPKAGFEADALSFAVYPSPTSGMATLRYNAVKNTRAQINVLDLNGRVIQSSSIELNQGNVEYGLDLSNVTNGVYFVQLVTENDVQTQRIQVLK